MRPIIQTIQTAFLFLLVLGLTQSAVAQCLYDIELTSDELTIQGNIFNTLDDGPAYPQEIEWFLPATGVAFSAGSAFELTVTEYGDCSICADYKATQQDGSSCTEMICKTVSLVNTALSCEASFEFAEYAGPMPVVGGITFNNLSSGTYSEWAWDFGDGNFDSESSETVTHFYEESGSYEVKLSIWSGTDCYAEYTKTVDVYISNDPCDQLDCVWPGDTNGDGSATLEDLINIGVGFGMSGPPREAITNDWEAQPAEDWATSNFEGINYKHFDCNGDGTISINDIPAIQNNYVMLENGVSITESNGIPVTLSFDVDTVVVTDENQELEINAGLYFGNSNVPMDDIYGVVLYLTYQKNYVVESEPVEFKYNENSFFGDMSSVIPVARNIQERGQTDVVLTRRVTSNISGQGRVASLGFIIESDIIDGRAENDGETFSVAINVVTAVDRDGNEIAISLSEEPAGVFFQNGITTTKAVEVLEDDKLEVYPNPVNEMLQLSIADDLHTEFVEVFDILGQRVIYSEMTNHDLNINVSRLAHGVYILKVKTEEGIGTRRVMVER